MPSTAEQILFEYAVIRFVPRVEREEFLNVGVILYAPGAKFLESRCEAEPARISSFFPDADLPSLRQHLDAICSISAGASQAGPIALLDQPSRFRWLTAVRSTILQTSRVHPGLTSDPKQTLDRLFAELVKTGR